MVNYFTVLVTMKTSQGTILGSCLIVVAIGIFHKGPLAHAFANYPAFVISTAKDTPGDLAHKHRHGARVALSGAAKQEGTTVFVLTGEITEFR